MTLHHAAASLYIVFNDGEPVELLLAHDDDERVGWRSSRPRFGNPAVESPVLAEQLLDETELGGVLLVMHAGTERRVDVPPAPTAEVDDDTADAIDVGRAATIENLLNGAAVGTVMLSLAGAKAVNAALRTTDGWLTTTNACRFVAADERQGADIRAVL